MSNADELKVASELAGRGHEITALPRSKNQHVSTPDFLVDGKPTELKTISNAKVDSVENSVTNTMKRATGQAKNVIIDARKQPGLTEAKARNAVQRAFDDLPKSALSTVQFLGRDGENTFEFTMTRK